jgi:hypothetical protein
VGLKIFVVSPFFLSKHPAADLAFSEHLNVWLVIRLVFVVILVDAEFFFGPHPLVSTIFLDIKLVLLCDLGEDPLQTRYVIIIS